MQAVTTVGLDIAKSVFQVHGVDADGNVVLRRQLKRRYVLAFFQKLPPCLIGIEACASSHYWSRELQALGHTVRLMPPAYVKPYVKRQKNDAADAEAICEAVTRPNMRFVPTKTPEQQSCLTLHRTRHLFIRQQTAVINSIRAYLAEFGIMALAPQWRQDRPNNRPPTRATAISGVGQNPPPALQKMIAKPSPQSTQRRSHAAPAAISYLLAAALGDDGCGGESSSLGLAARQRCRSRRGRKLPPCSQRWSAPRSPWVQWRRGSRAVLPPPT